jgi:regulator of protease activity HflC (stomatin/prohibitin superfamily)
VSEVQQVIITQFGRPVGKPVTAAGLNVKRPFVRHVNAIDKRIRGNRGRDLNKIQSEAYRQVEEIRGAADAKAAGLYAAADNQSREAARFYEFLRTMQTYKAATADNTTLVISTGSDLFRFLKTADPGHGIDPPRPEDGKSTPHATGHRTVPVAPETPS